jgi:hypothetical protein
VAYLPAHTIALGISAGGGWSVLTFEAIASYGPQSLSSFPRAFFLFALRECEASLALLLETYKCEASLALLLETYT